MRKINKTAMFGAVLSGALCLAGQIQAQDFGRDLALGEARQGQTLALNLTVPFGGDRREADAAPRLGLRFSQGDVFASTRGVDLAAVSFAPAGPRLRTAFNLNAAEGGGSWFAPMSHRVIFGLGVVLVGVGVYEATKDDNNSSSGGCGSSSNSSKSC